MKYNKESDKFLKEFYASNGARTWKQKLTLMEKHLDQYTYSHNPTDQQKVGMYEYELLELKGLIRLTLA